MALIVLKSLLKARVFPNREKNILQEYKEWYIDATEVEKLVELQ